MHVSLISYTQHALELLLFTKQTRLNMSPEAMAEVHGWSDSKKLQELEYMRKTIKSSWEFVDFVFLVEGVSRACTHQLVRTRHASFAQQSQRVNDMTDFQYREPESIKANANTHRAYTQTIGQISDEYTYFIDQEIPAEDARGILPNDCLSNIVIKANLRTLHEMAQVRLCVRTQGEYQDIFRTMRERVIEVYPWADKFLRVKCATDGICAFPNTPMSKCPVKPVVYDPETGEAYGGGRPMSPDGIHLALEKSR